MFDQQRLGALELEMPIWHFKRMNSDAETKTDTDPSRRSLHEIQN